MQKEKLLSSSVTIKLYIIYSMPSAFWSLSPLQYDPLTQHIVSAVTWCHVCRSRGLYQLYPGGKTAAGFPVTLSDTVHDSHITVPVV
jgi:hypothetical protein